MIFLVFFIDCGINIVRMSLFFLIFSNIDLGIIGDLLKYNFFFLYYICFKGGVLLVYLVFIIE